MGKIIRFASETYVQSEVENRLKTTEPQDSDDVRVYICGYDVIASGDYTVSVGLL